MSIFLHMGVHLITGAAILLLLLEKWLSSFNKYIIAGILGARIDNLTIIPGKGHFLHISQ